MTNKRARATTTATATQACGLFVGDGEDAYAALRAAGMADEVWATALVGVGYCGVYDLDEGLAQRTSKGITREFR